MARLQRPADGELIAVAARCLVGKSSDAAIRIDDPGISLDHASIQWNGVAWELRDLGSKNGTYLGGEALKPGVRAKLLRGARIGFARAEPAWIFTDDAPPRLSATRLRDGFVREGEVLGLPNDVEPEVSLLSSAHGMFELSDDQGARRPLSSGDLIEVRNEIWRVELPGLEEATPIAARALSLSACSLEFSISNGGEPKMSIFANGTRTDVEWRWFDALLFELARARLADETKPPPDRGWRGIDALAPLLGIQPKAINVATQRARLQLAELGIEDAAGIIEVRAGARRLGTEKARIERR